MSLIEVLLAIAIIISSAFLSSTEVALFSLTRFQLRQLRENFKVPYRSIKQLTSDPAGLLVTILSANEFLNISLTALIASSIERNWDTDWIWFSEWIQHTPFRNFPIGFIHSLAGTLIIMPLVLLFCETTPKVIGVRGNQAVAPLGARGMLAVYHLLLPIRWMLTRFMGFLSHSGDEPRSGSMKEEEFLLLVAQGRKEGALQQTEEELIKNVFELDDSTVGDIFIPIQQVYAVPSETLLQSLVSDFEKRRYTRVPVYSGKRNKVIGVLYSKDLLKVKQNPVLLQGNVGPFVRAPYVVRVDLKLNQLFKRMRLRQVHMAIVENEHEEAIGIVTMKDVLDEIFGDLLEEKEKRQ